MNSLSSPWRRVLPALLLALLLVGVLYRETFAAMVAIWIRSDTFAHGFLVAPISLWLIWRNRQFVLAETPRPSWWSLVMVLLAGIAWLLAELGAVNAVSQLAVTALLVLVVVALLGPGVARTMFFPLAFLFFAVPIGEFLMPQLMEWTAKFTVIGLRFSGVPVYQEGLQFVIPSGHWSVVEACSGIRYLIASMTVGTLFAYLNYTSLKRRLMFIGVSIAVPLIANWMRAYIIVMLGHLSGNKLAAGVDHLIYGWVFFGIVITLMFLIGARWAEPGYTPPVPRTAPVEDNGARFAPLVMLLGLLLAWPHLALWQMDLKVKETPALTFDQTTLTAPWKLSEQPLNAWKPSFSGAAAERFWTVSNDKINLGVYLAYYRQQTREKKLVSSENQLVRAKDAQWALVDSGSHSVSLNGQDVSLRTAELRGAGLGGDLEGTRVIAWQVYWVAGQFTANDHRAKLYTALSRLRGKGDDAAVLVVYAPKSALGEAGIEEFLNANASAIEGVLQRAHADR